MATQALGLEQKKQATCYEDYNFRAKLVGITALAPCVYFSVSCCIYGLEYGPPDSLSIFFSVAPLVIAIIAFSLAYYFNQQKREYLSENGIATAYSNWQNKLKSPEVKNEFQALAANERRKIDSYDRRESFSWWLGYLCATSACFFTAIKIQRTIATGIWDADYVALEIAAPLLFVATLSYVAQRYFSRQLDEKTNDQESFNYLCRQWYTPN